MAAHLAGVVAAHTTLPVVGVPLSGGGLNGVDALYSTVQMPKGIPVATVPSMVHDAALLVIEMLAISDEGLRRSSRSTAARSRAESGGNAQNGTRWAGGVGVVRPGEGVVLDDRDLRRPSRRRDPAHGLHLDLGRRGEAGLLGLLAITRHAADVALRHRRLAGGVRPDAGRAERARDAVRRLVGAEPRTPGTRCRTASRSSGSGCRPVRTRVRSSARPCPHPSVQRPSVTAAATCTSRPTLSACGGRTAGGLAAGAGNKPVAASTSYRRAISPFRSQPAEEISPLRPRCSRRTGRGPADSETTLMATSTSRQAPKRAGHPLRQPGDGPSSGRPSTSSSSSAGCGSPCSRPSATSGSMSATTSSRLPQGRRSGRSRVDRRPRARHEARRQGPHRGVLRPCRPRAHPQGHDLAGSHGERRAAADPRRAAARAGPARHRARPSRRARRDVRRPGADRAAATTSRRRPRPWQALRQRRRGGAPGVPHPRRPARPVPLRGIKGPVGTQQDQLDLFDGDATKVAELEARIAAHLGFEATLTNVGQVYPRRSTSSSSRPWSTRPPARRARVDHPPHGRPGAGDEGFKDGQWARRRCRTR